MSGLDYQSLESMLGEAGFLVRGGFHPDDTDAVPTLSDGKPVRTLVLVGNAGSRMWQVFSNHEPPPTGSNPMNTWTEAVLSELAERIGAQPWFPFHGPPYHPFQRWAQRAETVWPSPIGILVHASYGLWHAYRAVLGFGEWLELPAASAREQPCLSCAQRPCLTTCPVSAFDGESYDVTVCRAHLDTAEGADCLSLGCRARRACPVGKAFQYEPVHANFHMRAFLDNAPKPG